MIWLQIILQAENLYALPASQRKLMTLILRRLLASSTFAISGTLEALGSKLGNGIITKSNETNTEEIIADNFETFDELKDEWDEDDEEVKEEKVYTSEDLENIKSEIQSLKEFETLSKVHYQKFKRRKTLYSP
jgi:hypothetical protein